MPGLFLVNDLNAGVERSDTNYLDIELVFSTSLNVLRHTENENRFLTRIFEFFGALRNI